MGRYVQAKQPQLTQPPLPVSSALWLESISANRFPYLT